MGVCIKCKNINKSYNSQKIITNFNYEFKDRGLYTIYGESGSGKTTLLNILTGTIEYDSGEIIIFNKKNEKKVNTLLSNRCISYITQNNYFIDYLTIYDNLKVCLNKGESTTRIDELLKKMKLYDNRKKYPQNLSGGELQRLSIIIALLQNKKIIVLDEPTASLDKENAQNLITILDELKKDHLIICASHDEMLINISDEKIDINEETKEQNSSCALEKMEYSKKHKSTLIKYMLKRFFAKNSEKKSSIMLIIVITFVMLIFNLCYNYKAKVEQSLLDYYKVNYVEYYCNIKNKDHCDKILENYGSIENMYIYYSNTPDNTNGRRIEEVAGTLPLDANLLPNYEKIILYGSYYEEEKDIILGKEYAEKITSNPENLIGTYIKIQMPDKEESFRVAAILKDINENPYFQNMRIGIDSINNQVFFNDQYIKKYEYDGIPKLFEVGNGVVVMRAYFKDANALKNFYEAAKTNTEDITIIKFDTNFIDFQWLILAFEYYLTPGIIVSFLVALLFYYQTENIKNKYKSYILSVYKYYGYSWWNIIFSYLISNVISIVILFAIAFILMLILNPTLNYLFIFLHITTFKLFVIDSKSIFKLLICLMLVSIAFSIPLLLAQIRRGWLKTLKEGEDFL